jgi:type II secretory pathway predicted ATPase ExeA
MFGEVDFVVVNLAGEIVVIEQKAGSLQVTAEGLAKAYGGGPRKPVGSQINRTIDALRKQYARQTNGGVLAIDYLFYCPDYRVANPINAGIAAERIVDAPQADLLPVRVTALMGPGIESIEGKRVHRFFENRFDLVPDIHAHVREGERNMARLSSGLADTVSNIEMKPLRLRVRGTAGCGKSTVALRFAQAASDQGKRSLLVCFNRSLAEKMKAIAPPGASVSTFHGLLDRFLQSRGQQPDYNRMSSAGFWAEVQERVIAETISEDWHFQTLIVDEGQDFDAEWFDILRLFVAEDADILWLEDPDQAIRGGLSAGEELEQRLISEGFIGYRTRANYRSPQSIAAYIAERLPGFIFEAANPLPGLGVGETQVDAPEKMAKRVGALVTGLRQRGFALSEIVVLSLRGLASATLSNTDRVGNFTLSRPTGQYDLFGNQIHEDGQIRFDTIFRFKGQEAPAIILTDVTAFPEDTARRRYAERVLFAAMTRATVRLEVVTTT